MTTSGPTTFGQRTAEYLGYQLATRPQIRRTLIIWLLWQLLATCSILAAPPALASTLAGALNWTAIADSHGVPAGDFYLSVVSTSEAITKAGPGLTANPASWAQWLASTVTTGVSHQAVIELLQAQAACYIFMITMALWLLRFAMSSTWLYWLATWFRPLFETIRTLLAELSVFPICLVLGLALGAFHTLWHGRKGYGAAIMLSTFAIGIIGIALTHDPLTEMYNENGLLNQGRNLGFTVAQALSNNGAITSGGSQAQLQHLTSLITDATLRMPLQLMNFGTPIDDIGNCANAYSAAIRTAEPSAPAHAMANCGASQALTFAQHLGGANLALGLVLATLGLIFTIFVCYITYSYVMVCCAAFVNAILAVIAAGPAMIHGHPRRRAARRIRLFFKHAALVFAYTTYISIAALIVLKMAARGGYADQVGMTHPVARLVMIALVSAVAIGVFWWLKHELGDHTRQEFTHPLSELTSHGRDGYQRGQQAYDRAHNHDPQSALTQNHRPGGETSSGESPDQPLTGTPVTGRSPSGRPPTANSRSGLSLASQPSPPPTHQSDGLAAHAAVGQAAATALAPEVVAGHVAATYLTQKLHQNPGAPSTPPNMPPAAEASPGPPVAGRPAPNGLTVPPQPNPDIRSDRANINADRAAELVDQTPAEGRSLRA